MSVLQPLVQAIESLPLECPSKGGVITKTTYLDNSASGTSNGDTGPSSIIAEDDRVVITGMGELTYF